MATLAAETVKPEWRVPLVQPSTAEGWTIGVTGPASTAVSGTWGVTMPPGPSDDPELSGNTLTSEAALDEVDRDMLRDERLMRDIDVAAQAHKRARRNEEVEWDAVIEDHIL